MNNNTQYPPPNNYPNTPPILQPYEQQTQYPGFQQQTGTTYTVPTTTTQYQQQPFDPNPYSPTTSPPPQGYVDMTVHHAGQQPTSPVYNNVPITPVPMQHQPAPDLKPLSPQAAVAETRPVAPGSQQPSAQSVPQAGQERKHARHWTPPTTTQNQWNSGMCDCFDDWKICCIGTWFPCCLYSRTYRRLRSDPSKLGNGFSHCNTVACIHYCCGGGITSARQRSEIRYRYNLPGSECGDLWRHCCCGPCTLCQEEREVRGREREWAGGKPKKGGKGYEKPKAMAY